MSEIVGVERLLEHRSWVRGLARSLVLDDARADDLEQEVWISALLHPPRHGGALRAWLARLVRSRARDAARGERRRGHHERAGAARSPTAPSPDELLARLEVEKRIVSAVEGLREPYREAVLLRWFEGLPPREVAARLGVPVETVRTRLRRGLARIRRRLDADSGGDRAWRTALVPLAAALVPAAASAATAAILRAICVAALLLAAIAAGTLAVTDYVGARLAAAGGPDRDGVVVRDLATGDPVPGARFEVRVRAEGATRTSVVATDERGLLHLPEGDLVSLAPAEGDWRIPEHEPRDVLDGREAWIYRSLPVEGVLTVEGDAALNPTGVELAYSIDPRGLDPRSGRATWCRRVASYRLLPGPMIDGSFHVRVPAAGPVVLAARHPGWLTALARIPVPPQGAPARVDLVLRRACRVGGVVRREDGTPAGGKCVGVTVARAMSRGEYDTSGFARIPGTGFKANVDEERAVAIYWAEVWTDAGGRFAFTPPVDGEVWLFVAPLEGTRPRRIALGRLTADVPDLEVVLEDLRNDRRVRITRSGVPAAGAKVRIMYRDEEVHHHFRVTLDAKGEMPADLLTPGIRYSIRVDAFGGAGGRIDWTGDEKTVDLDELGKEGR